MAPKREKTPKGDTDRREARDTSPAWPADQTERRATASLVPYAKNARTHSPHQVAQIARSITEFGFTMPVLVDEHDGIIAGHGRVLSAELLKLETVPVIVARGWSEEKKRAYVLADNQIALNSGWDEDVLRSEIEALRATEFDLTLAGFDKAQLDDLFEIETPAPANTAPQLEGLSYAVIIRCTNEQHQSELLARLEADGLECEALIS
jgi:hypothetical protein